jgi:hypothetical protein
MKERNMDKASLQIELESHVANTLAETFDGSRGEWLVYDAKMAEGSVELREIPTKGLCLVVTESSTDTVKVEHTYRIKLEEVV